MSQSGSIRRRLALAGAMGLSSLAMMVGASAAQGEMVFWSGDISADGYHTSNNSWTTLNMLKGITPGNPGASIWLRALFVSGSYAGDYNKGHGETYCVPYSGGYELYGRIRNGGSVQHYYGGLLGQASAGDSC